jgi:hypothetical protein
MRERWKVGDIAYCKQDIFGTEVGFYAEVISHPIGDGTIMVRVPNEPATLRQVNVSSLQTSSRKIKWIHYAEVRGPLSFPVDMLRYDNCIPMSFEIEEVAGWRINHKLKEGWDKLVVVKGWDQKNPNWTDARWRSFGWSLERMGTVPYKPGT